MKEPKPDSPEWRIWARLAFDQRINEVQQLRAQLKITTGDLRLYVDRSDELARQLAAAQAALVDCGARISDLEIALAKVGKVSKSIKI